ncbi:MAG: SPOR domain-containing protein, partial [Burkholderiales bacterium]|nr:SPOR domain-containing protein [Burkholderiales bacterium]
DIAKMEENRNNQGKEQAVAVTSAVTLQSSDSVPQALEKILKSDNKTSPSPAADNNTGGFYLQLAAFAIRANAEASLQQLQRRLHDAKTDLQFHIAQQGNLYRLQSGPYASRDEANALLEQLASSGEKPMVVRR